MMFLFLDHRYSVIPITHQIFLIFTIYIYIFKFTLKFHSHLIQLAIEKTLLETRFPLFLLLLWQIRPLFELRRSVKINPYLLHLVYHKTYP